MMNHPAALERIDTDIHVRWSDESVIASYLPRTWRQRWLNGGGHTHAGLKVHTLYYDPDEAGASGDGADSQAALDPAKLAASWLEPHRIGKAILSVYDAPVISTFGDIDYPSEVARAVNRWMEEQWLSADSRFCGSVVVATQDPQAAATEIRRAARHPGMVQVTLPSGTRMPYGHRYYRPILEAAQECGLTIAIHGGTEGMGTSNPPTSCGWPGTVAEMRVARSTSFLAHMTSLITEGVFVEFPRLKVVSFEAGAAWVPAYLWRFDKNYKGLRSECPWLKELPSEYARRYFRFGTQGVEHGDPASEFWRLLASIRGEEMLLYSSNYPRWDCESPEDSFVLATSPGEFRSSIESGVAMGTYSRLGE